MKLPKPTRAPEHIRPYWHVDAKWICGLLLMASLGATLLLSVATSLTTPSRGVDVAATVIASAFSPDGLYAPINTTDLQARFAKEHTDHIAPIDNFPSVTITQADLGLPPHDLRLKIFRQIAQPIYDQGVAGAAKTFSSDPAQQQKFENQALVLNVFTSTTHQQLQRFVQIGLGVSLLLLIAVVYFSWAWGRLANPGLLLLLVGLPGTLAWLIVSHSGPDNAGKALGFIPAALTPDLAASLKASYLPLLIGGAALLVIAAIGKLISHHRHQSAQEKTR